MRNSFYLQYKTISFKLHFDCKVKLLIAKYCKQKNKHKIKDKNKNKCQAQQKFSNPTQSQNNIHCLYCKQQNCQIFPNNKKTDTRTSQQTKKKTKLIKPKYLLRVNAIPF